MNNQDIVDNAPEGATHIDVIGQYWMRFNGYRNKRWNKISMEWMPSPNCNLARSLADIAKIAELEKERDARYLEQQAKGVEDAKEFYSHKWSDEFGGVVVNIMKKGEGYIYPEGLSEYASQLRNQAEELKEQGKCE